MPAPSNAYSWPPFQTDRTVPTATDLSRLKQAGFDFARLPIDPGPFLYFTGVQLQTLLNGVAAAVDKIIGAGLSVVLNIQPNEATSYWNSARMVGALTAPSYPSFKAFAVYLATMLAARDQSLVAFEPMNEPGSACDANVWGPVQADLLPAIRAAAPALTLIATGPCGSLIQGLPYLDAASLASLAPIIFTVHFYEPYVFTHQGATWMSDPTYQWLTGVPWPATSGTLQTTLSRILARMQADTTVDSASKLSAWNQLNTVLAEYFAGQPDRSFVDHYLDMVTSWAAQNGINPAQILIGEMGALKTNADYTASDPQDRARYLEDVRRSAEARGLAWAMWDAFGGFGLIDDQTRQFDPAIVGALGLSMPT